MMARITIFLTLVIFVLLPGGCTKDISTPIVGTVEDIGGQEYKTIKIGSQVWMSENLNTTSLNDGTAISLFNSSDDFGYYPVPSYCLDQQNLKIYGVMYNFYTVNTGMLCPSGWHVPSGEEWDRLIKYLGGKDIAGGKLKEEGTSLWSEPNYKATNESGFTALPGGWRTNFEPTFFRGFQYSYPSVGDAVSFLSGTKSRNFAGYDYSYIYMLRKDTSGIRRFDSMVGGGGYVRCIMDDYSGTPKLPDVITYNAIAVTAENALIKASVNEDGGAPITSRGICWSTSSNPTASLNTKTVNGSGKGSFAGKIAGLQPGTTYFARAYTINKAGTAYGNEISFSTPSDVSGQVSDIEGNVYNTVIIGTQTWMAENLRATKYNDGSDIRYIEEKDTWASVSRINIIPVFCRYMNDATNKNPHGALYNWFSVNRNTNGYRNICPVGWHVPSDDEWNILTEYLGGEFYAGSSLKEKGSVHWQSPNIDATNESGFTALPGGYRDQKGDFSGSGYAGRWWSSTSFHTFPGPDDQGRFRAMNYNTSIADRPLHSGTEMSSGYSVRCVKN